MMNKEGHFLKKEVIPLFKRFLGCTAAILLLVSSSAAWATISPATVTRAWNRIFPLADVNAPQGPIHYESKTEPNAWVAGAGSGYSVHVTEGLLRVLNSEDEIAGILGHELGHIKLGHFGKSSTRKIAEVGIGLLLYDQVIRKMDSTLGKALVGAGAIAGGMLAEAGFSRQQEVEADAFGVRVASKAGYDPKGLYNAMMAMKSAGYGTQPNGFSSHPPTARRLKRLLIEANKYMPNWHQHQSVDPKPTKVPSARSSYHSTAGRTTTVEAFR